MTSARQRLGLLGAGRVAEHYARSLRSDPVESLELVAVCDLDESRAEHLAGSFGLEPFGDLDDMMRTASPDVVVVATPSGLHASHTRLVLTAGCHALVEKPIALIPDEVQELDAFAATKSLMYGAVFQNRYNPAMRKAKEAIELGRLGRIVTASVRLRWCRYQDYYDDGWHGTWKHDGGVISQQGIHHLDALQWLCGDVESVCAAGTRRANRLEAEDTLVATVTFASGALATVEATTAARPRDFEASISIVGEGGMIQVGGIALNEIQGWEFVEPAPDDQDVPRQFSQEVPNGYGLGHVPLLRDVARRLANGDLRAPVPAHDAVKSLELVHALYASVEVGGWQRIADRPRSRRLGQG